VYQVSEDGSNVDLGELGRRVRRLRKALGLTQGEVADRVRLSQPRICQIERGKLKGTLPERTLVDLADALGVRLADLVAGDPAYDWVEFELPAHIGGDATELLPKADVLIGRDHDVEAVVEWLGRDEIRLLTLTGVGGVGKTQLALQAATRVKDAFERTVIVPLAPCSDQGQVVTAIAYALGIREQEGRSLRDRLLADLQTVRLLLVLDNAEQVAQPLALLVAELLGTSPWLKVLVTSRVPLQIRGEHEYQTLPLRLPDQANGQEPSAIGDVPAVELFVRRAQAIAPDLRLTVANASSVGEIVRQLDGLPLAIELAAARVKAFPPVEMGKRLGDRLAFLDRGPRDLPARHRSLRAAIGWSYDLLDEYERLLFRRLSVFAGGFSTDALHPVVGDFGQQDAGDRLADHVATLLDWGLLVKSELPNGSVRFGMLETIREFAQEQLALANESAEYRRRHAGWCKDLAEQALPWIYTSEEDHWLGQLKQEDSNIQAALDWALGSGREADLECGLRLAAALTDYWYVTGRLTEGRRWLMTAVQRSEGEESSFGRARCLVGACLIAQTQSDFETAAALCDRGLVLAQTLQDEATIGRALLFLGNLAMTRGDPGLAQSLHEDALARFDRLGDSAWSALALLNLGVDLHQQGRREEAAERAEHALSLTRAHGNRWDTIGALCLLGDIARDNGDIDVATALFTESLALSRSYGSERDVAHSLSGLGVVAASANQFEQAARLMGAAEALYQRHQIAFPPPVRPDWFAVVDKIRDGIGASRLPLFWGADSPEHLTLEILGKRHVLDGRSLRTTSRRSARRTAR
jgi:predicted ATPase/DNA-binding XRE family transcriptional regulator